MANVATRIEAPRPAGSLREFLMRMGYEASVELNIQDLPHLKSSRDFLPGGARIYVSHLPKQAFADTLTTCEAVKAVGFNPIPHIPVRLLESHGQLNLLIGEAANCGVEEMLLISGDYANSVGPMDNVAAVMRSAELKKHGIKRVSIAGHPEGHSKVQIDTIRQAEVEKDRLARDLGLQATFVTQFFFESAPFLHWARQLRSSGVSADIRAGLAGPAKITSLLRFAARCGVGPSIKALGSTPGAFAKILGEHGPEDILVQLADSSIDQSATFQGIHMFCFGGYLRTCRWLHSLASGNFSINDKGQLAIQ